MDYITQSQKKTSHNSYLTSFQQKLLAKKLTEPIGLEYQQRIKIMLLTDQGRTQAEICKEIGCSTLTVRYWMTIAISGQAHQYLEHPIGRPKTINDQYLHRLQELVSQNPQDLGYSFSTWTGSWLSKQLKKEFDIDISARHINRLRKDSNVNETEVVTISKGRLVINNLCQKED